jgi:hypothetical protein
MSILKSGGSAPFPPSPGHVIDGESWQFMAGVRGCWRVLAVAGGCWRVILASPHVGDLPLWGGGGCAAWVAILLAFPPHREI